MKGLGRSIYFALGGENKNGLPGRSSELSDNWIPLPVFVLTDYGADLRTPRCSERKLVRASGNAPEPGTRPVRLRL